MAKWADYLISGVRYDKNHEFISMVEIYPDLGENLGKVIQCQRKDVIEYIKKGNTFMTIYKNNEGKMEARS